jgi:membrane fusion protein (multidrug efflux system)
MLKRLLLTLFVMVVLLSAIGFVKYRQVQAAISQSASFRPPPEAVTTLVAATELWERTVDAIGTVTAVNGVTVSADLPGIVESIAFESGRPVKAGDVLVRLDTRQETAQLAAARARLELTGRNLERARDLRQGGVIPQADYDTAKAAFDQAEASVGEITATIERKTITAPFSGVLGIRQVQLGEYLAGGAPVVPLQALDPIHVEFGVPQQQITLVKVKGKVHVTMEGPPELTLTGTISAIDSIVDMATRNLHVQATLANPGHRMRPGMFVRVQALLPDPTPVVALPASAILYAPYGDSVFIVENVKGPDGAEYLGVRQQVVKLGAARGDQLAVLSGVEPGQQVVTSGVFKLRNGAAVLVNNEVQPGNDPAPKPEDS